MSLEHLEKARYPLQKTLLFDFLIPLLLVAIAGTLATHYLWHPVFQWLVDFPIFGLWFYHSPYLRDAYQYRYFIFSFPFLFYSVGISWRTARIPGPGRALRRIWQAWLYRTSSHKEIPDTFPPVFDRQEPEMKARISAYDTRHPTVAILGSYKRYVSDIVADKKAGRKVEKWKAHYILGFSEEERYRHLQVLGNTGCGKTFSILAPILMHDAGTAKMASVTLNPKADIYLLKVLATGAMKGPADMPTGLLSFGRKESLAYDPLLNGDADMLTKKIMYAFDWENEHYRTVQESWLLNFFNIMRTEPDLNGRIMLSHLHRFLTCPEDLLKLHHKVKDPDNQRDLQRLSQMPVDNLSGLAANIGRLVKDESLSHIFNNPTGRFLNLQEVIQKGGNVYLDIPAATKGPQAHALGRMIIMEMQLLVNARQSGEEPADVGCQCLVDEFGSFAFTALVGMLDKCRSAKFGFVLCHQTVDNLERAALGRSFKGEIVDNTYQKIFLQCNAKTGEWASELLGERMVPKAKVTLGQTTDKTNKHGRESQNVSWENVLEPYVLPSDFTLEKGYGFGLIDHNGRITKVKMRFGYVSPDELCTDAELKAFLEKAQLAHAPRPLAPLDLDERQDESDSPQTPPPEGPKDPDKKPPHRPDIRRLGN